MAYFTDLFSPETYAAYMASARDVSGFRQRHKSAADRVSPGDKLICYLTRLGRWFGILEVIDRPYIDADPVFYTQDDPFIVRFKVRPIVLLDAQHAVPIREDDVWEGLSFTREHDRTSSTWTGKLRGSLVQLDEADSRFLEDRLMRQTGRDAVEYPLDEAQTRLLAPVKVRRSDRDVTVTVPEDSDLVAEGTSGEGDVRESHQIQALIADIGNSMRNMAIWIPRNDRTTVLQQMRSQPNMLLDRLPLNYDNATLTTIENIDVLWIRGRSIVRAFEVEHTTSVYSGILRMADLLALQPNMDIRLHIVAPASKREKVFQELQRPVFSLLERGPLAEACTYMSYDSLRELGELQHISHMDDTVLDEYTEETD